MLTHLDLRPTNCLLFVFSALTCSSHFLEMVRTNNLHFCPQWIWLIYNYIRGSHPGCFWKKLIPIPSKKWARRCNLLLQIIDVRVHHFSKLILLRVSSHFVIWHVWELCAAVLCSGEYSCLKLLFCFWVGQGQNKRHLHPGTVLNQPSKLEL